MMHRYFHPLLAAATLLGVGSLELGVRTQSPFNIATLTPQVGISSALAQTQTHQDRAKEIERLDREAYQLWRNGQFQEALQLLQQKLVMSRATSNSPEERLRQRVREGRTFNNMGLVYYSLREYPTALKFYQQALVIGRAINDKAGQAAAFSNAGLVYESLGQPDKAQALYQQASMLRRELNEAGDEGRPMPGVRIKATEV